MKIRSLALAGVAVAATLSFTAMPLASAASASHGAAATTAKAATAQAAHGGTPSPQVRGFRAATGVQLPHTHLPKFTTPKSTNYSQNWSGHAIATCSTCAVRYVTAEFNVPTVNCANSPLGSSGVAAASHWVGLDGYNSSTVEQEGVTGYCDSTGNPTYYAWYEMFPRAPVTFSGISPGDDIRASTYFDFFNDGHLHMYNLVLTDVTTGGFFNVWLSCPSGSTCKNSSAEVISEDPGGAVSGGVNLANFGGANFTGTTVTSRDGSKGTLATRPNYWTTHQIFMVNPSGKLMANTTVLYGGLAFNDHWISAS
jgi:Peptidase A4 family